MNCYEAAKLIDTIFALNLSESKPSEFDVLRSKIKKLTKELETTADIEQYYALFVKLFKQKKKELKSAQADVARLEKDLEYYKLKLFNNFSNEINNFYESEVSRIVKCWCDRTYGSASNK